MDYLIALIIIFVNFLFQTTILRDFTVLGVSPNTALVIVVCFALLKNRKFTYIFAIVIGILQDLFYGRAIGIHILIYIVIAFLIYKYKENLPVDRNVVAIVYVLLGTIIYHFMYYFIIFFQGVNIRFFKFLNEKITIELLLNVVWTYILYKLIDKIYKRKSLTFSENR